MGTFKRFEETQIPDFNTKAQRHEERTNREGRIRTCSENQLVHRENRSGAGGDTSRISGPHRARQDSGRER